MTDGGFRRGSAFGPALDWVEDAQGATMAGMDRLERSLRSLLAALRGEEDGPMEVECKDCGGLGVTASCRCHGSAQCPAAIDERCDACGGEGTVVVACATRGCRSDAEARCMDCDEAYCRLHGADHSRCGLDGGAGARR